MTDNETLAMPEGLCKKGKLAYDTIVKYLKENGLDNTGGCKTFYSPKEWKERGEDYGTVSLLVVVHDGGDHARAFSWDYEDYASIEGLNKDLMEVGGMYSEQCTCWYSAIYQ